MKQVKMAIISEHNSRYQRNKGRLLELKLWNHISGHTGIKVQISWLNWIYVKINNSVINKLVYMLLVIVLYLYWSVRLFIINIQHAMNLLFFTAVSANISLKALFTNLIPTKLLSYDFCNVLSVQFYYERKAATNC